jgi:ribosomal-protein-alanine N-acetyltransferase
MKPIIETERFIIREILPIDAEGMFLLDSDPEVVKYVGHPPLSNIQQSVDVIVFIRKQYQTNGIGRWAVILKADNTFVGWAGLKLVTESTNHHINYYDLGYRFQQAHWGKGYATEVCRAIIDYAFQQMQLHEIFAITDVDNTASRHILEKLGFQFKEIFSFDDSPTTWYHLTSSTGQ